MNAYVTLPHHLDHLAPVWHSLAPSIRGRVYVGHGTPILGYAGRFGLDPELGTQPVTDEPVLVASGNELTVVRSAILLEHGIGQTYQDTDHVAWPGGLGRNNVELFICPNERVAQANRARYPHARCAVVGSPHVEALRSLPPYPLGEYRIAISTHWESGLVPETRGAFAYFESTYRALCEAAPESYVLHGHPRHQDFTAWKAREWGVEFCPNFADLTQRAWLYITDNSSTLYEWAALGRPVITVTPPWYRRHVEHGLRFWEYADVGEHLGPDAASPDVFQQALTVALADLRPQAQRRRTIVRELFGYDLSAGAAGRAARAIEDVLARAA